MTLPNVQDVQTGKVHPCPADRSLQVGRQDPGWEPDLACRDRHVSRRHCRLQGLPDGTVKVQDQSTYGTFINGRRVEGEAIARPGDRLVLGHRYELRILSVDPIAATVAAPSDQGNVSSGTTAGAGGGARSDSRIPQRLGEHYRVEHVLGRGGMGVVYKAFDEQTQKPVAIKLLLATDEEERKARFEREARLAEKLGDYPAIVKVYDHGVLPDRQGLYLVMDYVDGVSLGTLSKQGVEPLLAAKLVARTARAVAYAHERGVVHRDLKPENVLVTREGHQVRLTDFGIAKEDGSGLTVTGVAMGTPNYMAPEQIEDCKRAGPLADVYGLGGILYTLLTGQPPYKGKGLGNVLRKVQRGDLTPPSELVPGLDRELESICRRALSVKPDARPPSAAQLAKELEAWYKARRGASGSVRLNPPGSD